LKLDVSIGFMILVGKANCSQFTVEKVLAKVFLGAPIRLKDIEGLGHIVKILLHAPIPPTPIFDDWSIIYCHFHAR